MMERDFMGLNSKESVGKEEVVESCKNSEYTKGSGVPWPVCNKGPTYPHSAYSGSMATNSADAFDTSYKNQPCGLQTIIGASSKPQIFGGVPVSVPHQSLPSSSILAGTTDSRYNTKATGSGSGPAQLTIFYGGKVNVFNEITPEKAQAIMILAGNHSLAQNIAQKRLQVLSPTDKLAAKDPGFRVLTVNNASPNSALSSPISVSSHPVGQIDGSPTRNDEYKQSKTTGISTKLVSKVEPSTLMASLGPVASPTMIPSAVPQFRKASLARFLEKRKERAINSAPYNLMKKTSGNSIPESQAAGGSASAASVGGSISPLTS